MIEKMSKMKCVKCLKNELPNENKIWINGEHGSKYMLCDFCFKDFKEMEEYIDVHKLYIKVKNENELFI